MNSLRLVACIALVAYPSVAQTPQSFTFGAASVRLATGPDPFNGRALGAVRYGGPGTQDPRRITFSGATLKGLIAMAYSVRRLYQVSGPSWLDSERYDIVATVAPGSTNDQVNLMLQNLLKDRFGLLLHHELKELAVGELVIAKGGPKPKPTLLDPNDPLPTRGARRRPVIEIGSGRFPEFTGPGLIMRSSLGSGGPVAYAVGKAQSMAALASMLEGQTHQPVLDKTGLTGEYDFRFTYAIDLPNQSGAPGASPDIPIDLSSKLVEAVEQNLGLKLVSGKANLDVIVVDKAEKVPTDN